VSPVGIDHRCQKFPRHESDFKKLGTPTRVPFSQLEKGDTSGCPLLGLDCYADAEVEVWVETDAVGSVIALYGL
jgi:hypothetical protein